MFCWSLPMGLVHLLKEVPVKDVLCIEEWALSVLWEKVDLSFGRGTIFADNLSKFAAWAFIYFLYGDVWWANVFFKFFILFIVFLIYWRGCNSWSFPSLSNAHGYLLWFIMIVNMIGFLRLVVFSSGPPFLFTPSSLRLQSALPWVIGSFGTGFWNFAILWRFQILVNDGTLTNFVVQITLWQGGCSNEIVRVPKII